MKTIKKTKLKAVKTVIKASAVKAPAAIPAPKQRPKPAAKKAPSPAFKAPRRQITNDLIAERAFIIWEKQGRPSGHDVANWLLAENQLKQEIQSFTA